MASTESSKHPPFSVSFVSLGQQTLMMAGYTIVIPHSNRLVWEQFDSLDASQPVWLFSKEFVVHLTSGLLIALQNVTGGLTSLLALRMATMRQKANFMSVSCVCAIVGAVLLVVGAGNNLGMTLSLTLLFFGRLVQGMGNGANFSAKELLTAFSSVDVIPTSYSLWTVAGTLGRGVGTLVVVATTFHPEHSSAGSQIGPPLLVLSVMWLPVLLVSIVYAGEWDAAAVPGSSGKQGVTRKPLPMPYRERLTKVLVSVFLGMIRHFVRTMWEVVSSLIFEVSFGYSPSKVAWMMTIIFFSTIPMVLYFPRVQAMLSDAQWMHAMVFAAMLGTLMLLFATDAGIPGDVAELLVAVGSLLVMGPLAVHATMSDFVGVKLADPQDWLLNPSAVVLMQIMSKNVVGQIMGPVIGRVTAIWPWRYFAFTVLGCLLLSEVLTVIVFDMAWPVGAEERQRLADHVTAEGSDEDPGKA